jgi:hypothetical protein
MTEESNWYYSTGGQEKQGPMSWEQIQAAHGAGLIAPDSYLWAPHLPAWVPARTLLGAPVPPPLPPPPPSGPGDGPRGGVRPPAPGATALTLLAEAPGAKAGRLCGIWALICMVLCFPVAIVLGILAIVKTRKAANLAAASPRLYRPTSNAGTVMGILALAGFPVLLFMIGIVSAISIPAFLGQRTRARDRSAMADLVGQYDKLKEANQPPAAIQAGLESYLRQSAGSDRNPWNLQTPAFVWNLAVVTEGDQGQVLEAARTRARAAQDGQCVFVIQWPAGQQPGHIGGAVRLHQAYQGTGVYAKAVAIE